MEVGCVYQCADLTEDDAIQLIPSYLQLCDDLETRIKDSTLTERQDDIDNNYIEISYAAAAYKSIDTEQNTSKKFVLCYCFTLILTFSIS